MDPSSYLPLPVLLWAYRFDPRLHYLILPFPLCRFMLTFLFCPLARKHPFTCSPPFSVYFSQYTSCFLLVLVFLLSSYRLSLRVICSYCSWSFTFCFTFTLAPWRVTFGTLTLSSFICFFSFLTATHFLVAIIILHVTVGSPLLFTPTAPLHANNLSLATSSRNKLVYLALNITEVFTLLGQKEIF